MKKELTKENKNVEKIIKLAGHHTFTEEILDKTAQNSLKSISEFYKILKDKGFDISQVVEETVKTNWHNDKEKRKLFEHIIKVFDISGITEGEKYVLMNMSILPSEYIEINDIKEWIGLVSNDDINSLVNKGWVKKEEGSHRIMMHQIIQEATRYQTKPDVEKCRKLVNGLTDEMSCKAGENRLNKVKYLEIGVSIINSINENDVDIATLASNMAIIYKDKGEYEKAEEYQKKTIEIFEKVLEAKHPILAISYINITTLYLQMKQLEKEEHYCQKGVDIFAIALPNGHPYLQTALKWQQAIKSVKSKNTIP